MGYRVYYLHGDHIVGTATLDCSDDAEAITRAKSFGADMEIWRLARFIARIDPRGNVHRI
jgi:hypothetical protein